MSWKIIREFEEYIWNGEPNKYERWWIKFRSKLNFLKFTHHNKIKIFGQDASVQEDCITIWGHSFGGTTAIRMAQLDKRISGS